MDESTEAAALPAWWHEIEAELANLNVVSVSVTSTGTTKTKPEWTVVVILHVEHFHYWSPMARSVPSGMCACFPWTFGARPTEEAAWKAAETFLRGLVAVRTGTGERVPYMERSDTPTNQRRLHTAVCSAVDTWHDARHVGASPDLAGVVD